MARKNPSFDEVLRHGLIMVGAVGARALAKGLDSALEDVDKLAKEAERRIKKTREGLKKIVSRQPSKEEEDDEE